MKTRKKEKKERGEGKRKMKKLKVKEKTSKNDKRNEKVWLARYGKYNAGKERKKVKERIFVKVDPCRIFEGTCRAIRKSGIDAEIYGFRAKFQLHRSTNNTSPELDCSGRFSYRF